MRVGVDGTTWNLSVFLAGTFDPIHVGHLRTAFELWQALRLTEVRFLPTGNPPHRAETRASAELRLAMVRAAVEGQAGFVVDDREVRRTGFSYSVDTLTELRRENPDRSLCVLLGMDAFLGLPNWHPLARGAGPGAHRGGASSRVASPGAGTAGRSHGGSRHRQRARPAHASGWERLCPCSDSAGDLLHGAAPAHRGGA